MLPPCKGQVDFPFRVDDGGRACHEVCGGVPLAGRNTGCSPPYEPSVNSGGRVKLPEFFLRRGDSGASLGEAWFCVQEVPCKYYVGVRLLPDTRDLFLAHLRASKMTELEERLGYRGG